MLNWFKKTQPSATIEYLLNDPLTPTLKSTIQVPLVDSEPRYFVQGYKGFGISEIQKQAAQVYASISAGLAMFKAAYAKPIKWSSTNSLIIIPRAGRGMNAFYDRSALQFFYDYHPITQKMVFTCESVNVTTHELGHAVLDAIRPDLWNLQSLEIFAFHESFGDIFSLLTTLNSDQIIDYVMQETNGNLRQSNIVSRIAEEMGNVMFSMGKKGTSQDSLRNAVNNLVYSQPEYLSNEEQEPHNFSRIFTGAWYDCLVNMYEQDGKTPESLKKSRDALAKITMNSIPLVAANPRFYLAFAKTMIAAAQFVEHGKYFNAVRKAFIERKIVSNILMCTKKPEKIPNRLIDPEKVPNRLIDFKGKLKTSHLPLKLLKVIIETPNETQDEVPSNIDTIQESAQNAVQFLHRTQQINDDQYGCDKCFSIKNGNLVRVRSCLDMR